MSIAVLHIQDGILQSVTTDDDDLQVILVDQDDQADEPDVRRFFATTVDEELAGQIWKEVADSEQG